MKVCVDIRKEHDFDVVICGGGTAGFCAALAAARDGARTAILEKSGMLGGTMTGGIPAPALFHAHGKQIIAGIGWELMTRLAANGWADLPKAPYNAPHPKLAVQLNPFRTGQLMDEMALEAGVKLFFHQAALDAFVSDGRIHSVLTAVEGGFELVKGGMFIDCTGDGSLAAQAGAAYELSDELQPATLNFVLTNFERSRTNAAEVQEKYRKALETGQLQPQDIWGGGCGVFAGGRGRGEDLQFAYALNPGSNLNHVYPMNGADSESRSRGEIEGRRSIARVVDWLNREIPGYEHAYVSSVSPEVTARESRRILGRRYITGDDYIRGVCPEDAVCYSFYPIDVHRGDTQHALDNEFHEEGRVPGIPYGMLVAKEHHNLLMAGRNASGDRRAQSAYRVQASCMAMGEAAGTAAAIACRQGKNAEDLDIMELKQALKIRGAIVPGMEE